jgi:hypothetical protein
VAPRETPYRRSRNAVLTPAKLLRGALHIGVPLGPTGLLPETRAPAPGRVPSTAKMRYPMGAPGRGYSRGLGPSAGSTGPAAGDWLSGRAPRSHRGGHWFDPSIAHRCKADVRPGQRPRRHHPRHLVSWARRRPHWVTGATAHKERITGEDSRRLPRLITYSRSLAISATTLAVLKLR